MYWFAHLALAQMASVRLQPAYPDEYAWGAVFPDIYLMGDLPKNQTHLRKGALESLIKDYPEQRSFVLGYRVHLTLDHIDTTSSVSNAFPVALKKMLWRYVAPYLDESVTNLLIEEYFIRRTSLPKLFGISGKYREIISTLGIDQDLTVEYAERVNTYIKGAIKYRGVERLEAELSNHYNIKNDLCRYRQLRRNPILSAILIMAVIKAGFDRIATGII